ILLAGLALITLGVIFKFNYLQNISQDGIPQEFNVAPVLTIIVGAIVFITAFFGCCGAIRESTCMLTTYAIILLSIFIIQVAIGVFAFIQVKNTSDFKQQIQKGLQKTMDKYGSNTEATEAVDFTQTLLECCGVNSPSDWHFSNGSLPLSCCSRQGNSCLPTSNSLHDQGCTEALINFLKKIAKVLGYVIIGIAATEIIGALFGLCLASSIRNHYRRNIYA
ncbi:hypothetical protein HHI36_007598, partial [Cryptolaemus montrouzieri]